MKPIKYISAIAVIAAISCAKMEPSCVDTDPGAEVKVSFSASLEDPTKVNLDAFPAITWEYTDVVKVYSGSSSADFTPAPNSIYGSNVVLEGSIALGSSSVAVYPASAAVSCTSAGVLTATLPSMQYVQAGEKLDPSALLFAAATTDKSLQFKNLCSLIKVTVSSSDVRGIVIEGRNGEYISGTANITLSADSSVEPVFNITEGKTIVDLRPSDFTTLAPGEYYIPVFPTAFTSGISVGVRTSVCEERTIGTSTAFTLNRNGGRVFSGVDATAEGKTPAIVARQMADIEEAADSGLNFVIGNDIDGRSQQISGFPLSSSIDGQNHNIYNCIIQNGTKAALFTDVTGTSVLKNFKFGTKDGSTYDGVSTINCPTCATTVYTGLVGLVAAGADLTLESVENFAPVLLTKSSVSPTSTHASGICGYAAGKVSFTKVKNHGNITNKTVGSIFAGGILANTVYAGEIKFDQCENNAQIKCDAATTSSTYLGGLVGKAIATGNILNFTNCTNNGYIYNSNGKGTVYVAGFVGNAGTGSQSNPVVGTVKFENCVNNGKIHNKTNYGMRLAGFVGSLYGGITAKYCTNNGPIVVEKATTDTRVGGFVGGNTSSKAGTLTGCVNTSAAFITVTGGKASFKAYVAGFVGNNSPTYTFTNCEQYGDLTINKGSYTSTDSYIGGFAGKGGSATVTGSTCRCSINSTAATNLYLGMLFGNGATWKATTTGVAGSINGTALDSDNWTGKLFGKGTTTTGVVTSGENACYLIDQTSLTVGTFNLWSPGSRKSDLADSKTSEERLWPHAVGAIANTINSMDCDIIAFNEIHSDGLNHPDLGDEGQLIARVNALNSSKYTWQMEFPNYADGRYSFCNGFAYDASKVELAVEPVRVWLPGNATTISTEAIDGGRTMVYAKFREKASGKEFWLASTHLALGDDGGESLYQAKCCVNWAKTVANHAVPSILLGDMNCATVSTRPSTMAALKTYWADSYDKAKSAGVLDADNTSKPATRPGTSKVGTGTDTELGYLTAESNRYDHIMVDKVSIGSYNCIRDFYAAEGTLSSGDPATGSFWPSDHFPIKVTILL